MSISMRANVPDLTVKHPEHTIVTIAGIQNAYNPMLACLVESSITIVSIIECFVIFLFVICLF